MLYWFLKWIGLGPLMRVVWRPWIEGEHNIPRHGPVIIASNHLSFCDSFFLPLLVRRRVTFLAKAEYFTTPGLKGMLSRLFFAGVGQVPIDRTSGDSARAALDTGARILAQDGILGIYPEGTRSPDGRLYRGKTGVARLAMQTGVAIVPCAMIGTGKLQPPGRRFPKWRPRPGVRLGVPITVAARPDSPGDRDGERALTDEVMAALAALSGQERVDLYAADVKAQFGGHRAFGMRKALALPKATAKKIPGALPKRIGKRR